MYTPMVRDLASAGDVLEAGGLVGEHRGQEVVGQDVLELVAGPCALAAIFREYAEAYRNTHILCAQDCRTAALGGHLEACDHCGAEVAR